MIKYDRTIASDTGSFYEWFKEIIFNKSMYCDFTKDDITIYETNGEWGVKPKWFVTFNNGTAIIHTLVVNEIKDNIDTNALMELLTGENDESKD